MTDATTQLAEIAEREAFETWLHSHPDNQGFQDRAAWLLSRYDDGQYKWKETHDRWIAWQGATSAAQARSREDAEIMREAAALIDRPSRKFVIAARLRARADDLEGRA